MKEQDIKLSKDVTAILKKHLILTKENDRLQLPYIEFTNPLFIEKNHQVYCYKQCFQIEKLMDDYYAILCLDGYVYLYDANYHTVLGKTGKRFKNEDIKNYYQTPEALSFYDKQIPYRTKLFRKLKPIQNDIARLYLLDGSCYFYNPKRNEIIGRDNHQLDTLEDCHFSHVIGYLYAISSQDQTYLYDVKSAEIIGTLFSIHDRGYRRIPKVSDIVVGKTKEGEFLYNTVTGKIQTPIFSMIQNFEIYDQSNPEYSTAQFRTYLDDSHNHYITGRINLDGSFIDKAITGIVDGRVTIYPVDDEMDDNDMTYQNILYRCKQPSKIKTKK